MSHKSDNLEIVHEGWLTKSPPTKRIWRARWRKRWFVLRHSGELPGQYYLYYYTDRNCRTLKGQIDLDQCDQVDAGLEFESSKHKYRHMFDVRTPKRTYYLAAETEADMNKWVDCVCHVCGLKAFAQDETTTFSYAPEDSNNITEIPTQVVDSPPVSPTSTASGPYIPISECITGKPINSSSILSDDFYDSPRRLKPPSALELRASESATPPLQSPGTDVESVFTDEEWFNNRPSVNWETFPHPSDSSLEDTTKPSFNPGIRKYKKPVAPPRPPKPHHLLVHDTSNSHTYLNIEDSSPKEVQRTEHVVNDMYDFPRSHQLNGEFELDPVPAPRRHCYSNAAPSNDCFFRYDFPVSLSGDDPNSPQSDVSSAHYSNVSSPVYSANPPVVNRDLKPGRKPSDSVSNEPSPHQPNVDLNQLRNLKPLQSSRIKDESVPIKLGPPPIGRSEFNNFHEHHSPSSRTYSETSDIEGRCSELDEVSSHQDGSRFSALHSRGNSKNIEIQYLDLDLDSSDSGNPSSTEITRSTVYKEVDFVKTEAFNRTRQKVEEERKQCSDAN